MFNRARWRIVAWTTFVVGIVLLIVGTAVYVFFSNNIYHGADQLLSDRKTTLLDAMSAHRDVPAEEIYFDSMYAPSAKDSQPLIDSEYPVIITDTSGNNPTSTVCYTFAGTFNAPCPSAFLTPFSIDAIRSVAQNGNTDYRTVSWEATGEPMRVVTFVPPSPPGVPPEIVQIGHSATGEVNALDQLRALLILAGIGGALLAALGGLLLANRSLVPIREAFVRQRQFTADASHELRTPLALIRANAEMLGRSRHLAPEDGELADEIIHETDHLSRLVSDLLTLARADTGALQLVQKPVDLRALVAQVHEDVRLIAEDRGIASTLSLNGPVTVSGDEGRLRQLLLILLDNAIKYTEEGGQVTVELSRTEGRARLVVRDTGIGIPRSDLERIFDRFYRVDRVREHEKSGTGLGLSIAQWIVQAHHGSIRADSDLGRGTTMQVDLPAGSGRAAGEARSERPAGESRPRV